MREIEGDMKTLVYENYSKFISATDTIRKMKSNVESMESEMDRLNTSMGNISQQCSKINQALEPNKTKIQQLSNIHSQLQRLQFIFELPNRLQRYLDGKQYTMAVKNYCKARKLLDHYEHMSAFKGIERDCGLIMDKIKENIWKSMKDHSDTVTSSSTMKINEQVKLLILLKEDPHQLWNTYIDIQLASVSKNKPSQPPSNVDDLINLQFVPLENIVDHFNTFFLSSYNKNDGMNNHDTGSVMDMTIQDHNQAKADLLQNIQPLMDDFFKSIISLTHLNDEPLNITKLTAIRQDITKLHSTILEKTPSLRSITSIEKRFDEFVADWENDLISKLLIAIPLEIKDRIMKFSTEHLQNQTEIVDSHLICNFLDDTAIWFGRYMKSKCFVPLKSCLQTISEEQQPQFLSRIQAGLKKMWSKTAIQIQNSGKQELPTRQKATILTFIISRLCYDFADHNIFQIYSDLSVLLYGTHQEPYDIQTSSLSSPLPAQMDPLLIPDVNEMIDKYVLIGQKLLNDNVQLNGYYLSNDIQNYYLKNMNITKETLTAVSTPWPKIVTHLKTLEQFILAIFPQHSGSNSKINNVNSNGGGMTGSNTGDNSEAEYDYRFDMNPPNEESTTAIHQIHSSHSISTLSSASTPILDNNNNINMGRGNGGGGSNNINNNNNGLGLITRLDGRKDMSFNMMNNIDKLFAERVDIYRSVDPSINSICGGLVRMVVKAFQETVRQLQGIDNILYQQLQLDIEFIQHTFWSYTTEEKWLSTILQDIIAGAYLRCKNPNALAQEHMEMLINNALDEKLAKK
ncbi:exocyst complex component Sec5-domain-containing protein [Cunninghamella echinulata]|nr:exocyst complex component Sec5-domain-containing protein [Cunninghamella echinulata]